MNKYKSTVGLCIVREILVTLLFLLVIVSCADLMWIQSLIKERFIVILTALFAFFGANCTILVRLSTMMGTEFGEWLNYKGVDFKIKILFAYAIFLFLLTAVHLVLFSQDLGLVSLGVALFLVLYSIANMVNSVVNIVYFTWLNTVFNREIKKYKLQ